MRNIWLSTYKDITNKTAMNIYMQVFVWTWVSISRGYMPRGTVIGLHMKYLISQEFSKLFQSGCTKFTLPPVMYEKSHFSTTSPLVGIINFKYFGYSNRWVVASHRGCDFMFPQWCRNAELIFMCLLHSYVSFSVK